MVNVMYICSHILDPALRVVLPAGGVFNAGVVVLKAGSVLKVVALVVVLRVVPPVGQLLRAVVVVRVGVVLRVVLAGVVLLIVVAGTTWSLLDLSY